MVGAVVFPPHGHLPLFFFFPFFPSGCVSRVPGLCRGRSPPPPPEGRAPLFLFFSVAVYRVCLVYSVSSRRAFRFGCFFLAAFPLKAGRPKVLTRSPPAEGCIHACVDRFFFFFFFNFFFMDRCRAVCVVIHAQVV